MNVTESGTFTVNHEFSSVPRALLLTLGLLAASSIIVQFVYYLAKTLKTQRAVMQTHMNFDETLGSEGYDVTLCDAFKKLMRQPAFIMLMNYTISSFVVLVGHTIMNANLRMSELGCEAWIITTVFLVGLVPFTATVIDQQMYQFLTFYIIHKETEDRSRNEPFVSLSLSSDVETESVSESPVPDAESGRNHALTVASRIVANADVLRIRIVASLVTTIVGLIAVLALYPLRGDYAEGSMAGSGQKEIYYCSIGGGGRLARSVFIFYVGFVMCMISWLTNDVRGEFTPAYSIVYNNMRISRKWYPIVYIATHIISKAIEWAMSSDAAEEPFVTAVITTAMIASYHIFEYYVLVLRPLVSENMEEVRNGTTWVPYMPVERSLRMVPGRLGATSIFNFSPAENELRLIQSPTDSLFTIENDEDDEEVEDDLLDQIENVDVRVEQTQTTPPTVDDYAELMKNGDITIADEDTRIISQFRDLCIGLGDTELSKTAFAPMTFAYHVKANKLEPAITLAITLGKHYKVLDELGDGSRGEGAVEDAMTAMVLELRTEYTRTAFTTDEGRERFTLGMSFKIEDVICKVAEQALSSVGDVKDAITCVLKDIDRTSSTASFCK